MAPKPPPENMLLPAPKVDNLGGAAAADASCPEVVGGTAAASPAGALPSAAVAAGCSASTCGSAEPSPAAAGAAAVAAGGCD